MTTQGNQMQLFGRRAARPRLIKKAPAGSIVYARHEIPGLLDVVPGGTRGTLLTWIHRDASVAVVVDWDGIGRRDARGTDLSPHFEPGAALPRPSKPAGADTDLGFSGPPRPLKPGERYVEQIITTEPYDPSKR